MDYIKRINIYLAYENWNESIVKDVIDYMRKIFHVLGFEYFISNQDENQISFIQSINILIDGRTNIRNVTRDKQTPKETKEKLFHLLDQQRKELLNIGINLQDTKDKSLWFFTTRVDDIESSLPK